MNFLGTESTNNHTVAGRLIPLMEAMLHAIDVAANKPAPTRKYSAELPAWGHNICRELTKTIFRLLVTTAPQADQIGARNFGRLVGIGLRCLRFWWQEAPAQLKQDGLLDLSEAKQQKLEQALGLEQLLPLVSALVQKPVRNQDELLKAGEAELAAKGELVMSQLFGALQGLAGQSVAAQYEFLSGIPEGFAQFLNEQGEFAGKRGRREIYILLLMYWPEIAEMQKAQPPKTRRDLLTWLEKQEGQQIVADEQTFFELCGDINLDLAPPGRPPQTSSP